MVSIGERYYVKASNETHVKLDFVILAEVLVMVFQKSLRCYLDSKEAYK